jgi:hypothetical protein
MSGSGQFRFESALLDEVVRCSLDFICPRHDFRAVIRETAVNGVIPDLLIASWAYPPRSTSKSKMTYVDRCVLAYLCALPLNSASAENQLRIDLHLSHGALRLSLDRLSREKKVLLTPTGLYRATIFQQPDMEIIAVETKLKKWREALAQAVVYKAFADRSYVILDSSQVKADQKLQTSFADAGVGLILFSKEGSVHWLDPVPVAPPRSPARFEAESKMEFLFPQSLLAWETTIPKETANL